MKLVLLIGITWLSGETLKEMKERGEIESINWVSKDKQLADPMTKAGASPAALQRTLCTGMLKSMLSLQWNA